MRYYFHLVSDHAAILDETGVDVTDLEAAEAEALKAIQELQDEDTEAGEDWQGWQLNVTDRSGQVFVSIPLDPVPQHAPAKQVREISLRWSAQVHGLLLSLGATMDHLSLMPL